MFSASTILMCFMAPKDMYTYENFRNWHERTKRRWRAADILGADEMRVLENNRRHNKKYTRKLGVLGWNQETPVNADGRQYKKSESQYADVIGDPYYDYFYKFSSYTLDWWGVGSKFTKASKKKRNSSSIPNTPMLDVSINFDSNSIMEKIYLKGMTYDEAISTTFKCRHHLSDLILELTTFNKKEGMSDEKAYNEALKTVEIVYRNIALSNNSPTINEYNFLINYYNKFIDTKIREMMKIKINFWFLKEVMSYNPNMSLYVLGPYNLLYRIQGLVSKRDQNVLIQMDSSVNSKKSKYEFIYSVARDTLVNEADKGFIPATKLTRSKSTIQNSMWGRKKIIVEHRYRTETFFDLILDGHIINGKLPWYDAFHNCWLSKDYSNLKNLNGLDIIC